MPELPEVETTRRGILPHIKNHSVKQVVVRNRQLRWPIPASLAKQLENEKILDVERRGKYLLLITARGSIIIHLGMSGSLRITDSKTPAEKHDHLDIVFSNGNILRYRDPRKFGCVLWTSKDPGQHKLLKNLGPEPLSDDFNAEYFVNACAERKQAIKQLVMNSQIVPGVGNIYANEALFMAGIHPKRAAGKISAARLDKLVQAIKQVLARAITQGGTTLRDFTQAEGQPGYFAQELQVYGRAGQACPNCQQTIRQTVLGQRSAFYCAHCQK